MKPSPVQTILLGAAVLLLAFTFIGAPEKKYSVSLTQEQWSARLQFINNAKEIMRKSSYPGSTIAQVSDSLDVIGKDISEQVGRELQAEAKKDTTKPVTNKH